MQLACKSYGALRGQVVPNKGRQHQIHHTIVPRAANSGSSPVPNDDDFTKAALHEAVVLYMKAKDMADQQLRKELADSWVVESHQSAAAPEQGSSMIAIHNFWLEQGLNTSQADRLTKEVLTRDPACTVGLLAAQLSRLYRILPEADVPLLVHNDSSMLDLDVNTAVRNLLILVEEFQNRDVVGMATKQPCLLVQADLEDRVQRTVTKLKQIHPSRSSDVVKDILEEYPQLLIRMDYYQSVMTIDELPIEIQNMMIIADQGIGFLHRYYNNQRKGSS